MQNKIIDGNIQSQSLRKQIQAQIYDLKIKPKLDIILIGNNPASEVYVNIKQKRASEVGIETELHILNDSISNDFLLHFIQSLNENSSVHGILVQMPLPKHINKSDVLSTISYEKDVDGFSPINVGRLYTQNPYFIPCTPLGIMHLIKSVKPNLSGMKATVIGRSNIVGRPIAELLLQENCTVKIVHSQTKNIQNECNESDILVAAVGIPNFVTKEFVKPGAIVIDVGISKINSKIVGDVHFENVIHKVSYITPVPGGVGPMTVAYLLHNTLKASNECLSNMKSFTPYTKTTM